MNDFHPMKIKYAVVNPGGNITAIVMTPNVYHRRYTVSRQILADNPQVEQVGFLECQSDINMLFMTGGEFCGNAARSALAVIHRVCLPQCMQTKIELFVSGMQESLTGFFMDDGEILDLSIPACFFRGISSQNDGVLVQLEGVSHLIIERKYHELDLAKLILDELEMKGDESFGVIFTRKTEDMIRIYPYVSFVQADERVILLESGCASGSIAAAIYYQHRSGLKNSRVEQPSGDVYEIEINTRSRRKRFTIRGRVGISGIKELEI